MSKKHKQLGRLAAIAALVFFVSSPSAQDVTGGTPSETGYFDCDSKDTEIEISRCAMMETQAADAALGEIYRDFLDTLSDTEQLQLRTAERAWVNFKEEICRFVGLTVYGPPKGPRRQIVSQCLTQMAREHAVRLEWQLNCRWAATVAPVGNESCGRETPIPRESRPSIFVGTEVALENDGGTFLVPVLINEAITLKFVLDSGASDVSIPEDVANTLMRAGTIEETDLLGTGTYTLADGSTVKSRTFRIRSLKVGDRVLENVTGSISPTTGVLLLGQSFLRNFKSWSIDNSRHVLVLVPN